MMMTMLTTRTVRKSFGKQVVQGVVVLFHLRDYLDGGGIDSAIRASSQFAAAAAALAAAGALAAAR